MAATRVVNRSEDRRAWSVRAAVGAPAMFVHADRDAAIAAAARELRGLAGGGTLHVFHPDGRLDYRTTIAEEPAAATSLGQRVQDDLDRGDNAVDALSSYGWPLLALLFGPALSSLVTQEIQEQSTFLGLFTATLALSLGVAAGWIVQHTTSVTGIPLLVLWVLALVASSWVAIQLGVGEYTEKIPYSQYSSHPVGKLLAIAHAAIRSYGFLGAAVGAAAGAYAGSRVVRYRRAHTAG